jgi:hypothetical protein
MTIMIIMSAAEYYSGWRQLCVRAQPCMQGSGDDAYLLCMLCCLYLHDHAVAKCATMSAGRLTAAQPLISG